MKANIETAEPVSPSHHFSIEITVTNNDADNDPLSPRL